ncbi:MAG: glycosyltransferase [Burkholderiales bacterium]|nr:glycosyltransferase [Burkholderiales bacterium]
MRRAEGERFAIPAHREADLTAGGLLMSEAAAHALWHRPDGRILTPNAVLSTYRRAKLGERPLRVLQMTHYDPGSSVYRYHSAANTIPGVSSVLVRFGDSNPHTSLRQWDGHKDMPAVRMLLRTADVVHCHMDLRCLFHELRSSLMPGQRLARTYHGSVLPEDAGKRVLVEREVDERNNAIVFGARPYHLRPEHGVKHWLPIPMPVGDYAQLATNRVQSRTGRPFRVAHSPTNKAIKGTDAFLAAVDILRGEGLNIEPVMIEGMEHGKALVLKSSCDATFDSFWLGMQGSGLEAAAMGQPVLAGDPDAQADLVRLGIGVPWTVANDSAALVHQLRRLMVEPGFYEQEASRVGDYVRRYHDYPRVGELYARILREHVTLQPPQEG